MTFYPIWPAGHKEFTICLHLSHFPWRVNLENVGECVTFASQAHNGHSPTKKTYQHGVTMQDILLQCSSYDRLSEAQCQFPVINIRGRKLNVDFVLPALMSTTLISIVLKFATRICRLTPRFK